MEHQYLSDVIVCQYIDDVFALDRILVIIGGKINRVASGEQHCIVYQFTSTDEITIVRLNRAWQFYLQQRGY